METAKVLEAMAGTKGCTPAQLALSWVLLRGEDIVALAGISRPSRIGENIKALDVTFTSDEAAELERAFAPGAIAGLRYPEFVMKWAAR
jgi:aryl-alcohol dehydrogenase-like predicted oxidoreductase